jgi:hypothetical protein
MMRLTASAKTIYGQDTCMPVAIIIANALRLGRWRCEQVYEVHGTRHVPNRTITATWEGELR